MERHGFARRAQTDGEFRRLVQTLQPLAPEYMSMPGSAPRLMHRTSNDDEEMANRLRASRELVKGRFAAGNVSYVLQEDLELYATAFRKPLSRFNDEHDLIQRTLQSTGPGPLSTRQLREETGLSHKKIMPAVHRLQQAFLLYEDQEDESWERPWSLFESEWPEVDLERMDKMVAVVDSDHTIPALSCVRHDRADPKLVTTPRGEKGGKGNGGGRDAGELQSARRRRVDAFGG